MTQKRRPNIIYLFADQWRRQAVGYANEDPVITPNIDKFSEEGMVFSQAVTCSPLCSPHRASLLTGKYPMNTGMYTNCKVGANVMLNQDEVCIGDVLKQAGYNTGYIGKWHLDLPEKNVSDTPKSGAEGWDAYTPPGPKRHGFDHWYSYGAWDDHLSPHYWKTSPDKIKVNEWSVEHETNKAIEFIENRDSEQPFALFVSWNPPHSPFDQVPNRYKKEYKNMSETFRENVTTNSYNVHTGEEIEGDRNQLYKNRQNYFAAITGIDENFGRILSSLDEEKLADDTIVVLTSDHGEMMGSHGLMAKHVWYEESIGVPFCIRWPNSITPAETDTLLNTVDIMPTLLRLANLDIPSSVEGNDLSAIIKGENLDGPDAAFICAFPGRKEAIKVFQDAGMNNLSYGWRSIRTKTHTYVIHKGYAPEEPTTRLLYDLKDDPFQMHPEQIKNLKGHPIVHDLENRLFNWLRELNDPFFDDLGVNNRI